MMALRSAGSVPFLPSGEFKSYNKNYGNEVSSSERAIRFLLEIM
jgi:hypothetical protein